MPVRHRNRRARKHFPVTAARFREARLSCFLTVEGCADLLRVSVRTVRNWESGTVRPPYAAYKLMRIMRGGKLLGPEWRGFTVRADRLNTPEGHAFHVGDLSWWSLLVRQAREFQRMMRERRQPAATERSARGRAGAAALPPPPRISDSYPGGRAAAGTGLVSFSNKVEQIPAQAEFEAENKGFHDFDPSPHFAPVHTDIDGTVRNGDIPATRGLSRTAIRGHADSPVDLGHVQPAAGAPPAPSMPLSGGAP